MEQEAKDFPIFIFMVTYISILCMYLVTYKQGSPLLWGFFIIERLISFSYEQQVDDYLISIEESKLSGMNIMITIVFTLFTVAIFLYAAFRYLGLFAILLLGETIDFVVKGLKKKYKKK